METVKVLEVDPEARMLYYTWCERWNVTNEVTHEQAMISAIVEYASIQTSELKAENERLRQEIKDLAGQIIPMSSSDISPA